MVKAKTSNGIHRDYYQVAQGVWGLKTMIVNLYMISEGDKWVLIDAGMPGSVNKIKKMAEQLFGEGTVPSAIILTHGHFDHIGSLEDLLKIWDVPVYAHRLEMPYLTGKSAYPPPDPTVGGGMMSLTSWALPKGPIDLGDKVKALPDDGTLSVLSQWRYIETPGHSPGHISLFRDSDKMLIAGDAFVTTKQESMIASITQIKKLTGPPMYFTPDWQSAGISVKRLRALKPYGAATGHGVPMYGIELERALKQLSEHFEEEAMPSGGRYVKDSARADEDGVQYVPPLKVNPRFAIFAIAGAVLITLAVITKRKRML